MKISYFPWMEFTLLTLSIAGCCVLLLVMKISFWFLVPAVFFAYLMTMRDAFTIVLDDQMLKITSFNFLIGSHSMLRKSIIKINSAQVLTDETYEVYGAPYLTLKKRYELEYKNSEGKVKKLYFTISNKHKEKLIMEALKPVGQGF